MAARKCRSPTSRRLSLPPQNAGEGRAGGWTWSVDSVPHTGDGLVVYELKHLFRDGTTHVPFAPLDLMAQPVGRG